MYSIYSATYSTVTRTTSAIYTIVLARSSQHHSSTILVPYLWNLAIKIQKITLTCIPTYIYTDIYLPSLVYRGTIPVPGTGKRQEIEFDFLTLKV